jgi:hypothetical protein
MVSVARLLEYIVCIEASSSPVIVFFVGSNPRVMPHKTKIGPVIQAYSSAPHSKPHPCLFYRYGAYYLRNHVRLTKHTGGFNRRAKRLHNPWKALKEGLGRLKFLINATDLAL